MSRRESDSKRYRSKFDTNPPSPKRSRRDGKPATERPSGNLHSEGDGLSDRDQKHSQRLRDALPLEAPPAPESKMEIGTKSKESEKRIPEKPDGVKCYSNPSDVQRPRSYAQQHDERDRRHGRGAPTERGSRRDLKDHHSVKTTDKIETRVSEQKDEKRNQTRRDDNHAWRHDGFYKMERDQQPPGRKRPAFRERKDEVVSQNTEKTETEPVNKGEERKEERVGHDRRESQRGNFFERDRYGGGGSYRGRERFNGRRGYQPGGFVRVEKWKHDLYEEANRSPTPKNEEDHIAKVEALLAS